MQGITIFAKQAVMSLESAVVTLLDTPGHVDFAAKAECTLSVPDCAAVVISGTAGVQSYTRILWQLLTRYRVLAFVFVNKMNPSGAEKAVILAALNSALGGGFVDFSLPVEELAEELAGLDEAILEEYINTGAVSEQSATGLIGTRRAFPYYFWLCTEAARSE